MGADRLNSRYHWNFSGDLFTITAIHSRMPVPMYSVRSEATGATLRRRFYSSELQLVTTEDWRIEKVIRREVVGGRERLKVKWMGFGRPEWIWGDQVVKVYRRRRRRPDST